jgi:hypothetical protein
MALGFGNVKKVFRDMWLEKREYDPELISIDDIELPIVYKSLDEHRVMRDMKSELETFKSLGYRFKKSNELTVLEYHSFQIGILLQAMKFGFDLKVKGNANYFPESIYKLDHHTIQAKVFDIIKKYDREVDKMASEMILRDDMLWTPIEASYLLLYLSFYQEYEEK